MRAGLSRAAVRQHALGPHHAAELETYKAKSVNNHLTVLRKMLNLAAEWGELGRMPKVKAIRVPPNEFQFLTFEEEPRFLAAVEKDHRALVFTALKTGLRVGELLGLKWEDVDLVAGRLVVRRNVWRGHEDTPKGGRSREVPLGDATIALLKAHRAATLLRGPYVFSDPSGERLNINTVDAIVPRACKKAGLFKRLTMHDLRHSFASHLVMRGAP